MLTNSREWDVLLNFSAIQLPLDTTSESIVFIPGRSLKGAIRAFLHPLITFGIDLNYIFGSLDFASQLHFSDFKLDTRVEQLDNRLNVLPMMAGKEASELVARDTWYNASFRGTVFLQNGGVYPSVLTYRLIETAIRHLRLGSNTSRGYGAATHESRMSRNGEAELKSLDPIQRIFRSAAHQMIDQIDTGGECPVRARPSDPRTPPHGGTAIAPSVAVTASLVDSGHTQRDQCTKNDPQKPSVARNEGSPPISNCKRTELTLQSRMARF